MKVRTRIFSILSKLIPPEATGPEPFVRRLLVSALLISLLVGSIVAIAVAKNYQQRTEQAAITVENLSRVLEESLVGSISLIDNALLAVADEATRQDAAGKIDRTVLNAFIERQNSRLPRTDGLRATNEEGSTQYGVGVIPGVANAVGRDYFVQLHKDPSAGLVLSKPLIGRISGKWAIIFARRHNRPDGSFNGVVFLPINLETFAKVFSAIDVGPHGVITLLGSNANIIVRQPETQGFESAIGKQIASPKILELVRTGTQTGVYSSRSSVDNIERLLSARKLADFPLFVVVGLAPEDYLAEWRRDTAILVGSWALFSSLLIMLSVLIVRSWRQRQTTLRAQELNRELEARVAERTRELEESNRKLEALSTTDGLTGVSNRRGFDMALAKEWSQASRTGQSIALAIFDVDLFKNYNDHYGHIQGDECLRKVAQMLNNQAQRAGDLVARFGGEEFVLLLPLCSAESALEIAKTACESVAGMLMPHDPSPYKKVTISGGVAACVPLMGEIPETLVQLADEAMYRAKKRGRNQVVQADAP